MLIKFKKKKKNKELKIKVLLICINVYENICNKNTDLYKIDHLQFNK